MLFYRVLRTISEAYAIGVLFIYIAMFGLALVFMFIMPPATIVLLWIGLFSLPVAIILGKVISVSLNSLSRGYLRMGVCPSCGHRAEGDQPLLQEEWTCPECDTTYTKHGGQRTNATVVDISEENQGQPAG